MSARERETSPTGQETKDRIIDAALATVRERGLVGASARVIARTGGFNQALVFYHFGSVDELLMASLQRANDRRIDRFRKPLEAVDSLAGLAEIAVALHAGPDDPDQPALAAIVAGWPASSELGERIVGILQPWDDLVEGALRRAVAGTPLAAVLPTGDLAHAVSCLFLGIELMSQLEGNDERGRSLFASLAGAARLADPLVEGLRAKDGTESG